MAQFRLKPVVIGTILITVQHEDGKIIIETFQTYGSYKYQFSAIMRNGKLNEEKIGS